MKKRLLFILAGLFLFVVVCYFVYTGGQVNEAALP